MLKVLLIVILSGLAIFGIINYLLAILRVRRNSGSDANVLFVVTQILITLLYLVPSIAFLVADLLLIVNPAVILGWIHFGWVIALNIVLAIVGIVVNIILFGQGQDGYYDDEDNPFMSRIGHRAILSIIICVVSVVIMIVGLSSLGGKTMVIDNQKQINVIKNIPNPEKVNYVLNTDVDCAVTGAECFGDIENYYGVFDGNNHTIKNISVSVANAGDYGMIINNHGTIKNLCISESKIRQSGEKYSYDVDLATLGAVCGTNCGVVENCRVIDTFLWRDTGYRGGFTYIGGIVGLNDGGTIKNCEFINEATNENFDYSIYMESEHSQIGSGTFGVCAGTICGQSDGGIIENCFAGPATTHTHIESSVGTPFQATGGIVGRATGDFEINNSIAVSTCSGSRNRTLVYAGHKYEGALIAFGDGEGKITKSYAYSADINIVGDGKSDTYEVAPLTAKEFKVDDISDEFSTWCDTGKGYPTPCFGYNKDK